MVDWRGRLLVDLMVGLSVVLKVETMDNLKADYLAA